ncbi:tRNA1(Val) (adenine(37)-N6)-methyltransferase [bacterium]|nr:tRNA1(Val) (adenine(37)-N6)-methyltransferase [bacterium]
MEEIDNILGYPSSHKIIQEKDAFSFSIDSTILSFFCEIKSRDKGIIDLGTGNGIIPLILSLRTDKEIIGLEIQKNVYDRARRSVELNGLECQIKMINDDILNVDKRFKQSSFSLVISNPPYFRINDSKHKNEIDEIKFSRHEYLITLEDLIKKSSYLLTDGGSLSIVQRTERFIETIELLKSYRLTPKRIRFVYPNQDKDSYVFLIDARKNAKSHGLKILPPLYIYDKDGDYTQEIKSYFHFGEKNDQI